MQVSGGPGTLEVILQALVDERPIVIIADSGGVATDIFRYFKWGDASRLLLMAFLIRRGALPGGTHALQLLIPADSG